MSKKMRNENCEKCGIKIMKNQEVQTYAYTGGL